MTDTNDSPVSVPQAPVYVGIDVAQDKLDFARTDADAVPTFANDPTGIAAVVGLLSSARPAAVVVEATGGLERPPPDALPDAGLPAAPAHPGRVRHFAKGLGVPAKADRIDARVLARFARFARLAAPRLTQKRSANQAELAALAVCRRQLTLARAEQSNRRRATAGKAALRSIDAVPATPDKQVGSLDKQIRDLLDADDDFRHLDGLLRSVPGVGPVLGATLAAELREPGRTDRRQVGALVGVAPFNCDSGKRKGRRAIRGGRTAVRRVLYTAALAAVRSNPIIQAFAKRLKQAGKLNKVVIVACMRKRLALLNAMPRDNLTWNQLDVVKKLALNH